MNIQSVLELLKFCDDVCRNFAKGGRGGGDGWVWMKIESDGGLGE